MRTSKQKVNIINLMRQLIVLTMLGDIMFVSKLLLEFLPNVHLLGALTITYTLVYRSKALIPIYTYVFLNGLYAGFALWWVPYLYLWTILWGITMLLPKHMPPKVAVVVYITVCGLHGLLFGTLYAPFQALAYGMTFKQTLTWITVGLPWDVVHCVGNVVAGTLIFPLSRTLGSLEKKFSTKMR